MAVHLPRLGIKVTFKAKPHIFRWSGKSAGDGTNIMTRILIMYVVWTTCLTRLILFESVTVRSWEIKTAFRPTSALHEKKQPSHSFE